MLAVEAVALEKIYARMFGRRSLALGGVTLAIPRGSVFGLIGVNGAGKTTFIKTILAVVRPTRGAIRVLGGSPEEPSIRGRIGYLPERSYYPPSATATSHLRSIARLKGLSPSDTELGALLERVGLAVTKQKVSSFSKGMKQRLGLAAALLGRPELLLLDEPTDGIDPLGRMEVRKILAEERDRGATIVLNSHLLAETERIADRVAILDAGKVVREGTLSELAHAGSSWRIRFAGDADPAVITALGFTPSASSRDGVAGADAWRIDAESPEALNASIDRARAAGLLVVELVRESHGLEDVLARLVAPSEGS